MGVTVNYAASITRVLATLYRIIAVNDYYLGRSTIQIESNKVRTRRSHKMGRQSFFVRHVTEQRGNRSNMRRSVGGTDHLGDLGWWHVSSRADGSLGCFPGCTCGARRSRQVRDVPGVRLLVLLIIY